jgi:hypothetical protein
VCVLFIIGVFVIAMTCITNVIPRNNPQLTYIAAVYEHAVRYPRVPTRVLPRLEALAGAYENLDVYEIQVARAAVMVT